MEIKKFTFKCMGDERGILVPIEASRNIPFEIKRVYYMYGTKEGVRRGFHAHKNLEQVLICISGSCKILMDDGKVKDIIALDKKNEGLYVGSYMWHEMFDFSEDAVLMSLASDYYSEDDYIRNYEEFLNLLDKNKSDKGFSYNNIFIHPKAIVDTSNIGKDTKVWGFSHILSGASIGCNCNINEHVFIENDVAIGDNVTVKCGVYVWDGITIEDNVFVGPCATFINDIHPRSKRYPEKFEKTILKRGCSLGANCTIMGGITIGEYATIGAGAVVLRNVKPYEVIAGNPGKRIGYNCKCGNKIVTDTAMYSKCVCGIEYMYISEKDEMQEKEEG